MALPTHHKGVSQMHQKKPAVFAVMASLLALVVAISWTLWKLLPQKAVITKGIAVLPFENLSPDPDNAYFTEGIHEEILTQLTTIHDLKVTRAIPRSATLF